MFVGTLAASEQDESEINKIIASFNMVGEMVMVCPFVSIFRLSRSKIY
jgi:hypothetical protein